MELSDQQKRLIEQKRQQAMAIREAKRKKLEPVQQVASTPFATKSILGSTAGAAVPAPSKSSPYFSPLSVQAKRPPAAISTQTNTTTNGKSEARVSCSSSGQTAGSGSQVKKRILISFFSSSRLSVFFPYDTSIISEIKKLPTSSYDFSSKRWTVAIEEYIKLIELLKKLEGTGCVLDADSVPARVISLMLSEKNNQPVDLSERLPRSLIDGLFPFQREGVKFCIRRNGRCIIADDMGLGKTVQALAAAYWFRADWPLIIVCPASVTRTWQQAIIKWVDFVRPDDIQIAESPSTFPKSKVVIMSYERLSRSTEDVMRCKANFVIFDESHSIKSGESQRTRSALTVAKAAKRVLLLSGTPALSRPMELYTQIFAVNPKVFPKKHDFGLRYCNAQLRYVGPRQMWDYKGNSNTEELRIFLESTVMIRRLKKDVLNDLPSKKRTIVSISADLTAEDQQMNQQFQNSLTADGAKQDKRKELMEWYNATASIKIPAVVSYLELKLKRVKKLICFAYHKVMVEALCEFLSEKRINYIVITGETPPKIRQECCNVFQEKENVRVAVVSVVAAGVGITLTAAHEVVFTELFWNPGILIQAEDRAHRIGQEEKVAIEYLLAKGTIDDVIWRMVEKKLNVLNKVGLSDDSMGGAAERDKDQSLIEDFFTKTKIKKEAAAGSKEEEKDLLSLFEDLPVEEVGATFNGLVSCTAASHKTSGPLLSAAPQNVVNLDDDDDEEFKFDDDDDDLFCGPDDEIQVV